MRLDLSDGTSPYIDRKKSTPRGKPAGKMFFHDKYINEICSDNPSGSFVIGFAECVIQSGCPRGTTPLEEDGSRLKGRKTDELMHARRSDCFIFLQNMGPEMVPYAKFAFALARASGASLVLGNYLTNQKALFRLGPFPSDVFINVGKEKGFQEVEGEDVFITMYASGPEQSQLKPNGVSLAGKPATSHSNPFVNLTPEGNKDTPQFGFDLNSTEHIAELLKDNPAHLMIWFAFHKSQLTALPSCGVGVTIRVAVPRDDDKSSVVYGSMTLYFITDGTLSDECALAQTVPFTELSFTDNMGEFVPAPEVHAVWIFTADYADEQEFLLAATNCWAFVDRRTVYNNTNGVSRVGETHFFFKFDPVAPPFTLWPPVPDATNRCHTWETGSPPLSEADKRWYAMVSTALIKAHRKKLKAEEFVMPPGKRAASSRGDNDKKKAKPSVVSPAAVSPPCKPRWSRITKRSSRSVFEEEG